MAKKINAVIKLQIPAGQANPAPPVGPALGQQGVNIMAFCKEFNAATQNQAGMIIPVLITVYQDKSFTFVTKSPPAAALIKQAVGLAKGSGVPNRDKVGKITRAQLREIVKIKQKDLNTTKEAQALRVIEGTARSMGVDVVEALAPDPAPEAQKETPAPTHGVKPTPPLDNLRLADKAKGASAQADKVKVD